jgi:hypothetical protein
MAKLTAKKDGKPVEPVKTGRKQEAPGKDVPKKDQWNREIDDQGNVQRSSDDTIVPRGQHPGAAVYVARDKKSGAEVSFDAYGRKLDSLGHVVAGDRQRAGDAGAKEIYRPPAPEPKGPPPQPNPGYTIGAGITPNRSGVGPARSSWDNSVLPGTGDVTVDRPVRESLRNYDTFSARAGWSSPSNWESKRWRGPGQEADSTYSSPAMQGPAMGPVTQGPMRMPWESFAGEYVSPVTREPMEAIPGFGMVPTANIPMDIGGLSMPQIYDPQGPRRDMPVEDIDPRYVPQGGIYDPQGRRRR